MICEGCGYEDSIESFDVSVGFDGRLSITCPSCGHSFETEMGSRDEGTA